MRIGLASHNPVKLRAAQAVFLRIDPAAQVEAVTASSGVADQPLSEVEARQGALNRARAALIEGAAYGVGFEGALARTEYGWMSCAWAAVAAPDGRFGLGGGVYMLLPPAVQAHLEAGLELGAAMDELTGAKNTKQGPGAVGILTDGLLDRQGAYEQILILALAPFRRPDYFEG